MPNDHITDDYVEHSETYRTNDSRDLGHDESAVLNEIVSPENEREDATTAGVLRSGETEADFADEDQWAVDVGVDVICSSGHKLGEVVDVRDKHVVVEKGFFMPEDVFVPKSAIAGVDEHHLRLNVTRDMVNHSHWDEDPEEINTERHSTTG